MAFHLKVTPDRAAAPMVRRRCRREHGESARVGDGVRYIYAEEYLVGSGAGARAPC